MEIYMKLSYDAYLDKVFGGFIGKSMGGAIGARFEGNKGWIELEPAKMFPDKFPPNDDLDLQVLWLKVLEEKGASLTSDDLAAAWLEWCWYPFNEYGIFRRNWKLGIHPPVSGRFTNQFWETGMGCPIRSEIWGYVFPGRPELAAEYAEKDGVLDHTGQAVGAEKMQAAMASMAFFEPDLRELAFRFIHYLPKGSTVDILTREAFKCFDQKMSLRDARQHLMIMAGVPEACDAQVNVPFTFLGILYGKGDLQETMLSALKCGYDTDCTLATAAAFLGQILGARRIPESLRKPVGDELVMGIRYKRPEMTISALARDTARVGVLLSSVAGKGGQITGAPEMAPFPATAVAPAYRLAVEYDGLPAAAPGEKVGIELKATGTPPAGGQFVLRGPKGWRICPARVKLGAGSRTARVVLQAPENAKEWPMTNLFQVRPAAGARRAEAFTFGVAGAAIWKFLGAYYDAVPDNYEASIHGRRFHQHSVSFSKPYLPEPGIDVNALAAEWTRKLGRPAVVYSYENDVDVTGLVGLRGPYCVYLARTVVSPEARRVGLMIGNNCSYRLYLNGSIVSEKDETTCWTPFNTKMIVNLRKGPNQILLKLARHGDEKIHFTMGFRANTRGDGNSEDWLTDLADMV
ncbi:MAG: hypothetical protein C0404_14330 [Verrucomicrobia bacterium]|nr:hypothetical protein [Verrucomicrobiota bacterium]